MLTRRFTLMGAQTILTRATFAVRVTLLLPVIAVGTYSHRVRVSAVRGAWLLTGLGVRVT